MQLVHKVSYTRDQVSFYLWWIKLQQKQSKWPGLPAKIFLYLIIIVNKTLFWLKTQKSIKKTTTICSWKHSDNLKILTLEGDWNELWAKICFFRESEKKSIAF